MGEAACIWSVGTPRVCPAGHSGRRCSLWGLRTGPRRSRLVWPFFANHWLARPTLTNLAPSSFSIGALTASRQLVRLDWIVLGLPSLKVPGALPATQLETPR